MPAQHLVLNEMRQKRNLLYGVPLTLPRTLAFDIRGCDISPQSFVRDMGRLTDCILCKFTQTRKQTNSLTTYARKTTVLALAKSKLHYWNAVIFAVNVRNAQRSTGSRGFGSRFSKLKLNPQSLCATAIYYTNLYCSMFARPNKLANKTDDRLYIIYPVCWIFIF